MKALEEKTLSEILMAGSKEEKDAYFQALADLSTNRISRLIVEKYEGYSIYEIYRRIQEEEDKVTSTQIFPGDIVILYPKIIERKAKDFITCDFSAGIIYPGSTYISYRPMLDNLTSRETYVLKRTIKVESGFYTDLPTTIQELEGLEIKMQTDARFDDKGIEYSHLNQRMGGEFVLQKLKRRKNNEIRNS